MAINGYLEVGTPVTHSDMANHREGYISKTMDFGFEIVMPEEGKIIKNLPVSILEKWMETAVKEGRTMATTGQVAAWVMEAHVSMKAAAEDRKVAAAKFTADKAAFEAELAQRMPEGFAGVIVAELVVDESDLMSDYHGSSKSRSVVIGFTKSARNLFPNMRKAAATFEPTAELATMDKKAEHRENYSMGGGTYLKGEYRHSSGWSVRIRETAWVGTSEFSPAMDKKFPAAIDADVDNAFEAIGLGAS